MNEPETAASGVVSKFGPWCAVAVSKGLAAIGIHQWSDAAALAAFIWTVVLIGDWAWKKWRARR